jgi:hypothetical protein
MTTTSSFLNLTLYNGTTDQSGSFINWTNDMTGSSNSNMIKIDNFSQEISACAISLNSNVSGSVTLIKNNISILSGSITALSGSINNVNHQFQKLDEYTYTSGSLTTNIIDFNNIPQDYTNLLIVGITGTGKRLTVSNVVIDFNGDANQANYSSVQWAKNNASEYIAERLPGGIVVGISNAFYPSSAYGAPLFAIIPNYSSSGGFYKTAIGHIATMENPYVTSLMGGIWKRNVPITRIRIGVSFSGTRYAFLIGSKVSLYGFG